MALNINSAQIVISARDETKAAFDAVKRHTEGIVGVARAASAALLGVSASAAGILLLAKNAIDAADAMNDLSKQTGLSVERISAWKLATEQSGTSIESLATAMAKGSKYIVEHSDNLQKLGIHAKTSEELLLKMAGIISSLPADDPRRMALAMEVFGKSAAELLPLLSEGEEGLRKMLERGRELSPMTTELAQNADLLNDQMAEFKLVSSGLGTSLATQMLPALTDISKAMLEAARDGGILTAIWVGLGGVMAHVLGLDEVSQAKKRLADINREIAELTGRMAGGNIRTDKGIVKMTTEQTAELVGQLKSLGQEKARLEEVANPIKKIEPAASAAEAEVKKLREQLDAVLKSGKSGDSATKAIERQKKAVEDLAAADAKYTAKQVEDNQKLIDQAKERQRQIEQAGLDAVDALARELAGWSDLTRVQQISWEVQTGIYKDLLPEKKEELLRTAALIDEKKKQLAIDKQLADLQAEANKNFESAQKAEADVLAERQRQHEEFWKSIDSTAHDTFVSIMDGGKSAWKRLKDTAKNIFFDWLYQMTIKKWIINIGATVTGTGVAGTALAAGGELAGGGNLGALSTVKSVYDVVKSGFSAANIAFEQGIQQFGSTLVDFGLDTIGGAISQYSALISNVSPFIGAGLALLQGDIKGAVSQGIGAGIGMAIGGPVGGLIGSVLGGAVGGLFGGKQGKPDAWTGAGLDEFGKPRITRLAQNDGGNAKATIDFTLSAMQRMADTITALGGEVAANANLTTKIRNGKLDIWFENLGGTLDKKYLTPAQFAKQSGGNGSVAYIDGKDEAAVAERVNDAMVIGLKKFATDLPAYLQPIIDTQLINTADKAEDATSSTKFLEFLNGLKLLHDSLATLPPVFGKLQTMIDGISNADDLARAQTTLAGLTQYYQIYYSDAEKLAFSTEQLRGTFESLGLTMPALTGSAEAMRAQFRALLEGTDQTTEAGRKQFEALIALAPAYAQAADATAQLAGSVTDLGNTAASAADILAQKNDLDRQLMEVMGDQAGLAALDRAKIYDANLAIYDRIQALKAEQSAAAQAAAAAEQAAASLRAIAQERYNLETQLLQEQGKTAELRARELELLDPSNRALQQQIWALQDQKAAAAAAASAASAMASSASSATDAFRSLADNIIDEIRRIRGEVAGGGSVGFAAAQANFAIATAKARAGDQAAWEALPDLSRTLLKLAELNATSLVDLNRLRGTTAGSLETTLGKRGYKVPSFDVGTNYVPADTLALVHAGEAIVPRQYNPSAGGADNAELLAEIRHLNERIARMEAHMASTSANSERTARVLDESARGKNSLYTRTTA